MSSIAHMKIYFLIVLFSINLIKANNLKSTKSERELEKKATNDLLKILNSLNINSREKCGNQDLEEAWQKQSEVDKNLEEIKENSEHLLGLVSIFKDRKQIRKGKPKCNLTLNSIIKSKTGKD